MKMTPNTKAISIFIVVAFITTSINTPGYAQVAANQMPWMPKPGVMLHLSPEFTSAVLKGITVHPENPLKFDFIIMRGDKNLSDAEKQIEYKKLIKYFMASLAVPGDNQWVNLSPYEKNRIITEDFGKTEMGRDLLAQDYILKQITASLMYPEDGLGKKFWTKVYALAQQQYGTTNISVNTFNKVWILPDNALIYEKGNTAYVLKNHLRVMLEQDYLSLEKHTGINAKAMPEQGVDAQGVNKLGSNVVREIILPALEQEVNEGKNFANLRQVYSGMILSAWYKRALKESLLSRIYADKTKLNGINQDPKNNEEIYHRYLQAYKKGVFNFIKEDVDTHSNQLIPRKYFSGGAVSEETAFPNGIPVEKRAAVGDPIVQGEISKEDDVLGQMEEPEVVKEIEGNSIMGNVQGNLGDEAMTTKQVKAVVKKLVTISNDTSTPVQTRQEAVYRTTDTLKTAKDWGQAYGLYLQQPEQGDLSHFISRVLYDTRFSKRQEERRAARKPATLSDSEVGVVVDNLVAIGKDRSKGHGAHIEDVFGVIEKYNANDMDKIYREYVTRYKGDAPGVDISVGRILDNSRNKDEAMTTKAIKAVVDKLIAISNDETGTAEEVRKEAAYAAVKALKTAKDLKEALSLFRKEPPEGQGNMSYFMKDMLHDTWWGKQYGGGYRQLLRRVILAVLLTNWWHWDKAVSRRGMQGWGRRLA